MQYHVFLSFCREDADIMRRVRDSLLAAGLTVWTVDEASLENSVESGNLESFIQNSGCCVVILSPDANGAASVDQHLDAARRANLKIFPVVGRGDEWSAIPKAFIGTQMIDVRANHDARMERLVGLIKTHLNINDE